MRVGAGSLWVVEDGLFRPCAALPGELTSIVCLHTHSCYSRENLASLNWVVDLGLMRPFKGLLQWSFGLGGIPDLDYSELGYHPPFRPDDIWQMETDNARRLGVGRLMLAITDHDEVTGSLELRRAQPEHSEQIALGEELSICFDGHVFHLGVSGLPEGRLYDVSTSLHASARLGRLDAVFEELNSLGCLVVLNHPLMAWNGQQTHVPALDLLNRYGWAVAALEINGMRPHTENEAVVKLANKVRRPLVGGGDSHLLEPSSALSATGAATYSEFVAEVRAGRAQPILTREYFSSLRWRMALRVLSFIADYRRIADFRGTSIHAKLQGRRVLLDPVGRLARWVLRLADLLGCSA